MSQRARGYQIAFPGCSFEEMCERVIKLANIQPSGHSSSSSSRIKTSPTKVMMLQAVEEENATESSADAVMLTAAPATSQESRTHRKPNYGCNYCSQKDHFRTECRVMAQDILESEAIQQSFRNQQLSMESLSICQPAICSWCKCLASPISS